MPSPQQSGPGGADAALDAGIAAITSAEADGMRLLIARRPRPGQGWFGVDELLERDAAPAVLLSAIRGIADVPPDHIRAEWLFESFARAVADLGGAFMVAQRRLPDLDPANLLAASARGLIRGSAVRGTNMTVLDADPVPDGSDIARVGDWRQLADLFHGGFVSLIEPLATWFDRHRLRPAKTLYKAAADCLAQSLVWSGRAFSDEAFALEMTRHLMDIGGPLAIPVERAMDEGGRQYHVRATCCLAYRASGGSLCQACPLDQNQPGG